jgi:D-sedoheptulose 7-phosphate isomerase
MRNFISKQIRDSIETKRELSQDTILKISAKAVEIYRDGKKTLIAGNGGSAADAQHIAGEFVSRFYFDRPALPSVALTTDTSILTAVGNDYGYEDIFSRQIEANGVEGDMFIAISTSGNSKNILKALKVAKEKNLITVGFTGSSGGEMEELCDYILKVPSSDTPRVQESHILAGHIICAVVEKELFGK